LVRKSFIFAIILLFSELQANQNDLISVVKRLLEPKDFRQHQRLIKRIFADKHRYLDRSGDISVIKVVEKLKNNGVLKLFFKTPRELKITFKSNGYPLFFIKLISDSLRSMGYNRFSITEAKQDIDGFYWTISLTSEYMIDPTLLQNNLQKRACSIVNIERTSPIKWSYTVDIEHGELNVTPLKLRDELYLKKPVVDYWLNVEKGKVIKIRSISDNSWFPYITLYDKELHILKRVEYDVRTDRLRIELPKHTKYIKISDIYHLNNLKNGVKVVLE
jgi:hypothetical protein